MDTTTPTVIEPTAVHKAAELAATTGPIYRATHGAEDWTVAEIEAQQNLAAIHQLAA